MKPSQAIARIIKLEDFAQGLSLECALLKHAIETMHDPVIVEVVLKHAPVIPDPPDIT